MGGKRGWRRGAAAVTVTGLVLVAGCDLGAPPTSYPAHGAVAGFGDVDGDGDLDVVTEGTGPLPGELTVLLNDGSGGFDATTVAHATDCRPSSSPTGSFSCGPPQVADVADLDGDGRADLLTRSGESLSTPTPEVNFSRTLMHVRLADGSGGFGPPVEVDRRDAQTNTEWRAIDATGDGDVDLVRLRSDVASSFDLTVRPGDGTGSFGPGVSTSWPPGLLLYNLGSYAFYDSFSSLAFADLDGDGHLDFVLAAARADGSGGSGDAWIRGVLIVGLGDGTGAFPDRTEVDVADPRVDVLAGVALGDVDEDGDLDAIAGNFGTGNFDGGGPVDTMSWFPGDGDGHLGPEVRLPAPSQTVGVQLADFDGDGHLDVFANTRLPDEGDHNWSHVVFGDGGGAFGDGDDHLLPPGHDPVVDVDGDGRPDLVRSVDVYQAPYRIEVFLNRWDGRP